MKRKNRDMELTVTNSNSRRAFWIYLVAIIVSLIGLGDSIYLTAEHLAGRTIRCTVIRGCSEVLGSSYAKIAGLPTASFGILAYFTVFSLATLALFGYRGAWKSLSLLVAAMFLATLWFVYLQAFVLHAFCQFCLLSAGTTTILLLLVLVKRYLVKDLAH
ncbi:MAG: vitamin K epoxide reductase family protein [Acidobacteria bacterium]|nr:vitamin K epoxide reductase family protein [Acidobacteriota bacterium]